MSARNDPMNLHFQSQSFGHNIMAAWAHGYTGKGVVVSVLDDGIEKNHPDLAGNYVSLVALSQLASFDIH